MATQEEHLQANNLALDRETEELLIVAEGIVQNLWVTVAERVGVYAPTEHEFTVSTMTKLGEQAARTIVGFDENDRLGRNG